LQEYQQNSPIHSVDSAFWAIESFECAYFHIGNIKLALHNLWTEIKMNYFSKPFQCYNLDNYLRSINKDKNWLLLKDEPYNIRVNLVHLCRHTFHPINNVLYLPDYVKLKQYLWSQIKTNGWVSAEQKLTEHLEITYKTCEDVYTVLIPTMENFLITEGINI
jgi:hypothetical protein